MQRMSPTKTTVTSTSKQQIETELKVVECLKTPKSLTLEEHCSFIKRCLLREFKPHSGSTIKPLFVFNGVTPLAIMGRLDEATGIADSIKEYFDKCLSQCDGLIGGGYMSDPHTAYIYTTLAILISLGKNEMIQRFDREKIYTLLLSLKTSKGSFRMHNGSETDLRSVYSALVVASLLGILRPALTDGVAEFIARCQTYEGGLSAYPGCEAHGGYSFCGFAALLILRKPFMIDVEALLRWAVARQMKTEGGFQGRTNKLVDSCYSFWIGALFPLFKKLRGYAETEVQKALADRLLEKEFLRGEKLKRYILDCCQGEEAGFSIKPGIFADLTHTCFSLCGLSIYANELDQPSEKELECFGGAKLKPIDLIHCIEKDAYRKHFESIPKDCAFD